MLEAKLQKASGEKNDQGDTFHDRYSRAAAEQEQLGKTLREEQKLMKDQSEPNQLQIEMLKDLKKLLRCTMKTFSSNTESVEQGEQMNDRLVLA